MRVRYLIFTLFSVLSLPTLAGPALPPAHVVSPLHPEEFALELSSHPDQQRVAAPDQQRLIRVAGPFPSSLLPNLQISSFGVIPKRGQPGKWRLIVDLSSPEGSSINDGIDPQEFTL